MFFDFVVVCLYLSKTALRIHAAMRRAVFTLSRFS